MLNELKPGHVATLLALLLILSQVDIPVITKTIHSG
jgi:hypothetical protein